MTARRRAVDPSRRDEAKPLRVQVAKRQLLAGVQFRHLPGNVWVVSIPLKPGEEPPAAGTEVRVTRRDGGFETVTVLGIVHHYKERVEMAFEEKGLRYAERKRQRRAMKNGGAKPERPGPPTRPDGAVIRHATRPFRVGEVRAYALEQEDREDLEETQGQVAVVAQRNGHKLVVYVVVVHAEQEADGEYTAVVRLATADEVLEAVR